MQRKSSAHRGHNWFVVMVGVGMLVASSGCISNYDFESTRGLPVERQIEDLSQLKTDRGTPAQGLFDVAWVPLVYGNVELLRPVDTLSEGRVPGHSVMKLRSYLPLFCAHHTDSSYYDEEAACYERTELTSFLWGLWKSRRVRVATEHGDRVETERQLLWLLRWGPEVRYQQHSPAQS